MLKELGGFGRQTLMSFPPQWNKSSREESDQPHDENYGKRDLSTMSFTLPGRHSERPPLFLSKIAPVLVQSSGGTQLLQERRGSAPARRQNSAPAKRKNPALAKRPLKDLSMSSRAFWPRATANQRSESATWPSAEERTPFDTRKRSPFLPPSSDAR